jgi:hypothetical protein
LAGFDDAAVSIALPKIPDGGFSPVRLQGRNFKHGLPTDVVCLRPSCPLLPPFTPALCQGQRAYKHLRASGPAALPQGPSLRSGLCCPDPSTLNRPHPPRLQAHSDFAVSRFIRNAIAVHALNMPRQPITGSELSLMVFCNMSSSKTTGNSPAANAQYFARDAGLQLHITVSAFPSVLTLRFW